MSEVQRAYEANMAYDWIRLTTGRELQTEPHLSTHDAFGVAALAVLRDWRHGGSAG